MRWGKSTKVSADSRDAGKTKRSRLKTLSNKQLTALNTRMRLEKDFKKHTQKDYTKLKSIIGGILKVVGSMTVTSIVVEQAGIVVPNPIKLLGRG